MILLCPVSLGEVIDKLSILTIKCQKITDREKLLCAQEEKQALTQILSESKAPLTGYDVFLTELIEVNLKLWEIEDRLRACESKGQFDTEFVSLARQVYKTNDHRFEIKKRINQKFGSKYVEVKSYTHC